MDNPPTTPGAISPAIERAVMTDDLADLSVEQRATY